MTATRHFTVEDAAGQAVMALTALEARHERITGLPLPDQDWNGMRTEAVTRLDGALLGDRPDVDVLAQAAGHVLRLLQAALNAAVVDVTSGSEDA